MDLASATFEETLRMIAERRLLAQMHKEAADSARTSQSARQTLGVLGADEAKINQGIEALRGGRIGKMVANVRMHAAVPGIGTQLNNIPASIGTALQQGRPGDALAQADIAGVKNILPWSGQFSPTTLAASLGLGGTAATIQHIVQPDNFLDKLKRHMSRREMLYGLGSDASANMEAALGDKAKTWQNWHPTTAAPGKLQWLTRLFDKRPHEMRTPGAPHGPMPGSHFVHRHELDRAVSKTKPSATKSPLPKSIMHGLGAAAIPAAAASIPLLYREWLGRGHRSGRKPIQQLIEANQPGGKR
jgi:hypothetical protein